MSRRMWRWVPIPVSLVLALMWTSGLVRGQAGTKKGEWPTYGGDLGHTRYRPALENRKFATLAEYSHATNQDRHSILVDYDIFVNVPRLDREDYGKVQKVYKAEDFDFRLRP